MNGRMVKVALVLLVLMAVCIFGVPAISGPITSGEHPWGSDRGDGGDSGTKPAITDTTDSTTVVTTHDQSQPTSGGTAAALAQLILQVAASVASII